jgi:hypothetical protein
MLTVPGMPPAECVLLPEAGGLLSDGAVAVNPAALKEAMLHHAVAKQKEKNCQEECKQPLFHSERGWLWFGRLGRVL